MNRKDQRKVRADILSRKSKIINPLKAKIEKLEAEIDQKEKHLATLNDEIIAASGAGGGAKISSLSKEIHATRTGVDALFDELESLITELEEKTLQFDRELEALSGAPGADV